MELGEALNSADLDQRVGARIMNPSFVKFNR
jgi:hypothetical protein